MLIALRTKDDLDMLWKLLTAMSSCVSLITSRPDTYGDLIKSIFSYTWDLEPKITVSYVNLISNIISCNATYLIPSFQMLVKNLVSTSAVPLSGGEVIGTANADGYVYLQKLNERQMQIHKTIHGIIGIVPTGQSELYPILCDHFPYKKQPLHLQTEFITQLFTICDYLPVLQYKILELIVTKCLEIDVEIIIEDTGDVKVGQDEEVGGNLLETDENDEDGSNIQFRFDEVIQKKNKVSVQTTTSRSIMTASLTLLNRSTQQSSQFYKETLQKISDEVAEMAEKLDAMLVLVIGYIDGQLAKGEESADRLFHHLMGLFEEKILVIHRSKFVQYIMFYITSKVKRYCYIFIRRILQVFYNDSVSSMIRQSAIAYLASYLSRAVFVPASYVNDAAEELIRWSHEYVLKTESDTIEYDDILPHAQGSARPVKKKQKSDQPSPQAPQNHVSTFASCRRPIEAEMNPSNHGLFSDSFLNYNKTNIQLPVDILYRGQSVKDPITESGELLPASTHWVKLDGRTHRHRRQLINAQDDLEDVITKANDTMPPLKFIPNDSCGNLAELLSNTAVSSFPVLDRGASDKPVFRNGTDSLTLASRNILKQSDLHQHETFYCCVQASAYIACFHGVYLLHEHMMNEGIRRLWECVLTSTLNPLKYCLHSVKSEFLRVSKAMDFLRPECWNLLDSMRKNISTTIMPVNGKSSMYMSGMEGGGSSNNLYSNPNPLDSFFPFDPCLLCKLNTCHIGHSYRSWFGIPGLDYDDDSAREFNENFHDFQQHHGKRNSSSSSSDSASCSSDSFDETDEGLPFAEYNNGSFDEGYESVASIAQSCESKSVSWINSGHTSTSETPSLTVSTNLSNGIKPNGSIPFKRRPRQPSIGSNFSTGSW